MNDFLNKLYSYQNFSFYLIISIIVLVVLFFVVLFYGKKDKKQREIEATKKLQQIESEDAFKEEDTEERADYKALDSQKLENDTIAVPTIEDFYNSTNNMSESVFDNEPTQVVPLVPLVEERKEEVVEPITEPIVEEKVPELKPIFEKEEEKPLLFDELDLEVAKKEDSVSVNEEPVSVPTFNFEEVMKSAELPKEEPKIVDIPIVTPTFTPIEKPQEIYSSVYIPPKEVVPEVENIKVEVSKPIPKDEEFELPALKQEEKTETKEVNEEFELPVLNNYNLDELSGEVYNIKK